MLRSHIAILLSYSFLFINGCKTTERNRSYVKAVPQNGSAYANIMNHGSDKEKEIAQRVKAFSDKHGSKDPSKFVVLDREKHKLRSATAGLLNGSEDLRPGEEIFVGTVHSSEIISVRAVGISAGKKTVDRARLGLAIQVFDIRGFTSGKDIRKDRGVIIKLKNLRGDVDLKDQLAREFQKVNALIGDQNLFENLFGKKPKSFQLAFDQELRDARLKSKQKDRRNLRQKQKDAEKTKLAEKRAHFNNVSGWWALLTFILGAASLIFVGGTISGLSSEGWPGLKIVLPILIFISLLIYFIKVAYDLSVEAEENQNDIDFLTAKLLNKI